MSHSVQPIVLVVEDEVLIRMMVVEAFLEDGFTVLQAGHAAEALLVFASAAEIQVLFTDVNMPGEMNGIDLAERLKSTIPALHILIASALPILRPVDHLPALFIPKPYDAGEVSRAALALLAA